MKSKYVIKHSIAKIYRNVDDTQTIDTFFIINYSNGMTDVGFKVGSTDLILCYNRKGIPVRWFSKRFGSRPNGSFYNELLLSARQIPETQRSGSLTAITG